MAQKYEKVLALMRENGGVLNVDDPKLASEDVLGPLVYRLAAYIWNIRKHAGLEVRGVRTGRKVTRYELVALVPASTPAPAAAVSPEPEVVYHDGTEPESDFIVAGTIDAATGEVTPAEEKTPVSSGWSVK